MSNHLECLSIRHGNSKYYDIEFSKKIDLKPHPTLTRKIEELSSSLKSDALKIILQDDGQISISILEDGKYVVINEDELNHYSTEIIKSISKIAKKLKISSAKEEPYKPLKEKNIITRYAFEPNPEKKESSFSFSKLFSSIHKYFALHFIVRPTIEKSIKSELTNLSRNQIKSLYINNEKVVSDIKEKIIEKSSSSYEAFETRELEILINNIFLEKIENKLEEKNLPNLSQREIYNLDVFRIISNLKRHNFSQNEYEKLLKVKPLEIPIEQLSQIPINAENHEVLCKIWSQLLKDLFKQGKLDDLYRINDKNQIKFINAYIEARSKLPLLLNNKVKTTTNKLDEKQSLERLIPFYIQNTTVNTQKKPPFSDQINLYNSKVKDEITKAITDLTTKNGAKARDAVNIAEFLTYEYDVLETAKKIYSSFSNEEKLVLNVNDIATFYFNSLEKIALEEFGFTAAHFKDSRYARSIPTKDRSSYMYNEEAMDSLENKIGKEKVQNYKDLLFVSKSLDPRLQNSVVIDNERFQKLLLQIGKDDQFKKLIRSYVTSPENEYVASILSSVPAFFLPIAKKILNPKNLELKAQNIPYGISTESIEFISKYLKIIESTEKSAEKVEKIKIKADALIKKYKSDPLSIEPNERLSVQEVGILSKVRRDAEILEKLTPLNLDHTENPILLKALETAKNSNDILSEIESIVFPSLLNHYRSGDLLAYDLKKKEKWHNRSASLEERLTSFASSGYTHGGKLLKDKGSVSLSHLLGGVVADKLDLYGICISDIFEINIKPLFKSQIQSILEDHYGKQWASHVNKIYVDTETKLHSDAKVKFDSVENDPKRRTYAALADFPRLTRWITGRKDIQSHEKEQESSRMNVYNDFFGEGPKKNSQICSEWASKATLAAMMETNRLLAEDLAAKTGLGGTSILEQFDDHHIIIPADVREYLEGPHHWGKHRSKTKEAEKKLIKILKENNYNKNQIELILRIGNKEIFDLPYSRKERLKTIHPGRMVELLAEKKCLKKRELPPVLMQLIEAE